jgi:hypothetical protein
LLSATRASYNQLLQRRFAEAGTKTPSERVPLWTETACRFRPKSPAGLDRKRLPKTPKFARSTRHSLISPAGLTTGRSAAEDMMEPHTAASAVSAQI